MGLNITHTINNFQFENRENLRNTAKNILSKQESSKAVIEKIVDSTIFAVPDNYSNSQLAIIKASSQITLNNSMKETLKYLKSHANKKTAKEPVLGELWNLFNENEIQSYEGELMNFEIDLSLKNIFEAA